MAHCRHSLRRLCWTKLAHNILTQAKRMSHDASALERIGNVMNYLSIKGLSA